MQGWETVDTLNGEPVIVKKACGRGWLYYIGAELPQYSLATIYQAILSDHKVSPMAEISRDDRNERPANVELHKAVSGEMTAWYFMNCDSYPKIIRMKSGELKNNSLVDPFRKKALDVADGSATILLPPHKPTVVVSGPAASLETRFGRLPVMTRAEIMAEKEAVRRELSKTTIPVVPGRCLDLKPFCNKGFDNQQGWTAGSAWFDRETKDLPGVPWGKNVFGNTECQIIRMDFNENKTCIALSSRNLPDGWRKVDNIPVGEPVAAISFFHAVTFGKTGEQAMTYQVHYADGSSLRLPVVVGKNIGDWNIGKNAKSIRKMTAWKNGGHGFFRWTWKNPEPGKEISALSILSSNGESTPIVVGITTHPAARPVRTVSLYQWKFSGRGEHYVRTESGFEIRKGKVEIVCPPGKPLVIPEDKMEHAVLRYSINHKPDQWGFSKKLEGVWSEASGITKSGAKVSSGASGGMDSALISRRNLDRDPETWQEVSVPFKYLVNTAKGRISAVTGISFWTWMNENTILIRDLRIEYEENFHTSK